MVQHPATSTWTAGGSLRTPIDKGDLAANPLEGLIARAAATASKYYQRNLCVFLCVQICVESRWLFHVTESLSIWCSSRCGWCSRHRSVFCRGRFFAVSSHLPVPALSNVHVGMNTGICPISMVFCDFRGHPIIVLLLLLITSTLGGDGARRTPSCTRRNCEKRTPVLPIEC